MGHEILNSLNLNGISLLNTLGISNSGLHLLVLVRVDVGISAVKETSQ